MHEDDAVPMLGGIEMHVGHAWQLGGERRAASLDRLAPFLDGFGTLLTVFLAGMLALVISERIDLPSNTFSALMLRGGTSAVRGWGGGRVMRVVGAVAVR